jgi:predicted nicotinamide N-methyase
LRVARRQPDARAEFIRINTAVLPVPLAPEIRLHLAAESIPLWQRTEEELEVLGLPPPFWAFAWAGGQALARHVLDHPEIAQGRSVLDLAAGSGLVGIAAARVGAAHVLAADIDAYAVEAIRLNAALNEVRIDATSEDLLAAPPAAFGAVLVGDLFYEKALAERVFQWLLAAADAGADVLIGDPGRSYLPRDRLERIAEHAVPVTRDLEDAEIKATAVWALRAQTRWPCRCC